MQCLMVLILLGCEEPRREMPRALLEYVAFAPADSDYVFKR